MSEESSTSLAGYRVLAKSLTIALAVALGLAGLAGLGASLFSQSVAGALVGSASDDQVRRGAATLAHNFHDLVLRARWCSIALLIAALLVAFFWRKVRAWIEQAVLPLPGFLREAGRSMARGVKTGGVLNTAALGVLFLLGVALRFRFLFRHVEFDEADSFITFASRPLYIGLSWYPEPNNHLLNTLLMHISWRLFGDSEWALRLPAFLAGCLLIAVTYWAARVLYDKHVALIATGLVAAASPLVGYSVDGRGYSIQCVVFLLMVIVSHYLLEHDSQPAWLCWALLAALGFYAVPTMLYAVATLALWMILSASKKEPGNSRRRMAGNVCFGLALTGVLTATMYLPVLIVSGWRSLVANPYVAPKDLAYLFANFPINVEKTWRFWTDSTPAPLRWVLTAGLVAGLAGYRRIARHRVPLLLAFALCVPPMLLVQRVLPFPRVWIFLLPECAAAAGAGLWLAVRRLADRKGFWAPVLSAAIALGCLVPISVSDLHFPILLASNGVENSVLWMKEQLQQTDVVMSWTGLRAPLAYYFVRHAIRLLHRPAPCDPMQVVLYSANGSIAPGGPGGADRLLIVTAGRENIDWFNACLAEQQSPPPKLLYNREGTRIYMSSVISVSP